MAQEREEYEQAEEIRKKQLEVEMLRLEREAEERERLRRLEEHKSIKLKVAKERIEQLKLTSLGTRALAIYSEEVRMMTTGLCVAR